jgi:transposase InsO family protein
MAVPQGLCISREKVRRLMKIMCLKTIYPRPRTTICDPAAYKYPYLLRGLNITRVNQVWQLDISYIPIATRIHVFGSHYRCVQPVHCGLVGE